MIIIIMIIITITRAVGMRAMPLFPETVTLNLLLGSDAPDYCNFKMVSSWPSCIQFEEKRDVCKTCMPPLMASNSKYNM